MTYFLHAPPISRLHTIDSLSSLFNNSNRHGKNILEVILKTINDVQAKNASNPKQETTETLIFDLIRGKLQNIDSKSREKRVSKGKTPESIFDLIKKEINGARKKNKKDPNVKTAPPSIFDEILRKIDKKPKQLATSGLKRIVDEYNINVAHEPKKVLQQVQQKMMTDQKNFDHQHAQAISDLARRY